MKSYKSIRKSFVFLSFLSVLIIPVHSSLAELEELTAENINKALDAMLALAADSSDPSCIACSDDNPCPSPYPNKVTGSEKMMISFELAQQPQPPPPAYCNAGNVCGEICLYLRPFNRYWNSYPMKCATDTCPPVIPSDTYSWCYVCGPNNCDLTSEEQSCRSCCDHFSDPKNGDNRPVSGTAIKKCIESCDRKFGPQD